MVSQVPGLLSEFDLVPAVSIDHVVCCKMGQISLHGFRVASTSMMKRVAVLQRDRVTMDSGDQLVNGLPGGELSHRSRRSYGAGDCEGLRIARQRTQAGRLSKCHVGGISAGE